MKLWNPKAEAIKELTRHGRKWKDVKDITVHGQQLRFVEDPINYWTAHDSDAELDYMTATTLIGDGFHMKVVRDEDGLLRWQYMEEEPQKKQKKPWMTYGLLLDICASILGLLAIAVNNIPAAIFAAMIYLGNGEE